MPCKWLYDDRGSELFEEICRQPEYYPTRTELAILRDCVPEIGKRLGGDVRVVEYGAGSGEKTQHVLEDLGATSYVPIDISRWYLDYNADLIGQQVPGVSIHPVEADYTNAIDLPETDSDGPTLAFFPGGTIGNFKPRAARDFLANVAETLGNGAHLLLGVDLRKDPQQLHAAYNDAAGVTAAFNLNVLTRINRELGADFDVDAWRHYAPFNPSAGRIEMHLIVADDQQVTIADRTFAFERGTGIHTEDSHKYTRQGFAKLAGEAGWDVERFYTDADRLFSVQLLRVAN